jgi:Uncharacterized low-complexity proteins
VATTRTPKLAEKIVAVRRARNASFVQLVEISGLDPTKAFRFANLSGVDLRGQDLRGFDFTGADLRAALLDPTSLGGAVITDALLDPVFHQAEQLDPPLGDLEQLSEGALARMLRSMSFEEATQLFRRIDRIDRTSATLLTELIKLASDDDAALHALRTFFRLDWAGQRTYRIVQRLVAVGTRPIDLKDALDLVGYVPANASQLGTLLKAAGDFETANFIYKRFERLCSAEHLALLGRHIGSPIDYAYLRDLAGRFGEGREQELIALRALPSAQMVRSALNHSVGTDVAALPAVQVILAEKARKAEDVLELLSGADIDRPLRRIVDAAMATLKPREAYGLMKILASEHTPLRIGGDIWTGLLLDLYLKRSDEHWRWTMFNDHLQWNLSLEDLRGQTAQKKLKFRDLAELAAMFTSALDFDLEQELSHLVKTRWDAAVLESAIYAARHTSSLGASSAIEAFRSNLRDYRKLGDSPTNSGLTVA